MARRGLSSIRPVTGVILGVRSQSVRRAGNTSAAFVQNVGIDHCGTHIIVPQELLHRPDIITILKQLRREEWRKVWQLAGLAIPRSPHGLFYRLLQNGLMKMMPQDLSRSRIDIEL